MNLPSPACRCRLRCPSGNEGHVRANRAGCFFPLDWPLLSPPQETPEETHDSLPGGPSAAIVRPGRAGVNAASSAVSGARPRQPASWRALGHGLLLHCARSCLPHLLLDGTCGSPGQFLKGIWVHRGVLLADVTTSWRTPARDATSCQCQCVWGCGSPEAWCAPRSKWWPHIS